MTPELHFEELISILRRRRRLILAITVIGTTLVLLGSMMIRSQYTATAQIVIEAGAIYPGEGTQGSGQSEQEAIVQTHITALASRAQLERVLESLSQDPDFRAAESQAPSGIHRLAASLWHKFGTPLWDRVARLIPWGEAQNQSPAEAAALRLERFQHSLKVYQQGGSYVIDVAFQSTSPTEAALVANRVAQLYVKSEEERKQAQVSRIVSWLNERIPVVEAGFKQAETAVQNYRVAHGLADSGRNDLSEQKLAELSRRLISAEDDLAKRQAELGSARDPHRQGANIGPLVGAVDSPAGAELRRQEDVLLQSEAEAAVTLGENHPKARQLEAELQEVRHKLSDEEVRASNGLTNEARIAADQVTAIRKQLSELQAAESHAQEAEPRLNELEHDASAAGQIYEGLLQRREQLRTQQEVMQPASRILSLAAPPALPGSYSRLLFILPALITFSIGAGLLAVAAERLQKGMRSAQDVNDALGIPCVGFVPLIRRGGKARPHQYLLANPFAAYTESIRSVAAALQLTAPGRAPKVILISSSVPNEGKTTLAVSLAVYFALIGRRTLLIDLDFRHPAVARELGGQTKAGVFDAILPDVQSWIGSVQQVPGLHLDYLPVPGSPGDPLLPFVGGNIPRVLSQLRDSYDCVVVDSPPLLAVAEARLLIAMADKVLFAVQWGRTQRVVAQDALDLLRDHGHLGEDCSELVGAVLTQVDLKKHAQYRYSGLETIRETHRPSLPRPKPDDQAANASARDALLFEGRAALGQRQPSDIIAERLSEPRPDRSRSAWGRRIGVLVYLAVGILFVPSDSLLWLMHPAARKTAALDTLPFAARVKASQDTSLLPIAGNASALETTAWYGAAKRKTAYPARAAAVTATTEHQAAKDRVTPASPAAAQTSKRVASHDTATPAHGPKLTAVPSPPSAVVSAPATTTLKPTPIAAMPPAVPTLPLLSVAEVAALVARGDAFVGMRDIASARLFYLRAAAAGDGRAAMRMAVTFDPEFLDRANIGGAFANPREALSWYQKARDLGAVQAESHLKQLLTR
jgi:polysaccharide biosynthesis transport protein